MWWILQIIGSLAVVAVLTYSRIVGLSLSSYFIYILAQAAIIGWCFPVSYMKAPSFLQAWFLGNSTLAVGGFIVSIILKDAISTNHIVGAILAVVGAILLIV